MHSFRSPPSGILRGRFKSNSEKRNSSVDTIVFLPTQKSASRHLEFDIVDGQQNEVVVINGSYLFSEFRRDVLSDCIVDELVVSHRITERHL